MFTALIALTLSDAARLGHDDFWAREAAEARLSALRPLSWPALAFAARSPDVEARMRARRTLQPSLDVPVAALIDLHAWWAFYGPDQIAEPVRDSRRWLCPSAGSFYDSLPDDYHVALSDRAVRWGLFVDDVPLVGPASRYAGARHGWINVARHRAHKVKMPW